MTEKITNPNYHILLDMDGVLSNFVGGVEKLFNADLSDLSHWGAHIALGLTSQEFWTKIAEKKDFWATLEPYPWARDLVQTCEELTKGNVTICTSPGDDVNCASQKVYWLRKHFPQFRRAFLIGPQKHLLAKPTNILIDDSQANVDKFRHYGGLAIEFPQLWNESKFNFIGKSIQAHDYIKSQVELIFVQNMDEEEGLRPITGEQIEKERKKLIDEGLIEDRKTPHGTLSVFKRSNINKEE